MSDGEGQPSLIPQRAGDQLKAAREAQGLDLTEIAARTRIPQRHLESIEKGNYSALPSTTYATGFARAYARAIGIDDVALVNTVRGELAQTWNRPSQIHYEPDDPARVPSRGVMWLGILVAVVLAAAAALWFGTTLFKGGGPTETAPAPVSQSAASDTASVPVPAPSTAGGQVALTATDEVWVRIYDGSDKTLLMRTLAAGERYALPAGVERPMINVGRPDKLEITVNGSVVAPLGDGRAAIKDVPIDARALLARAAPAPAPTPTPAASPTASPRPAATTAPRATPRSSPTRPPASPTPRATPPPPGAPESLLPPGLETRPGESR